MGDQWLPDLPAVGRLPGKGEELRQPTTGRGGRPWDRHCGVRAGDIIAPTLPNLVAPLREGRQVREFLWVDYVPDLLDLVH